MTGDPENNFNSTTNVDKDQPRTSETLAEASKKNRDLLKVPSRSSSNKIQPSPTSTGLSGATASEGRESIGGRSKESKASFLGRKRNGSAASSKMSIKSPGHPTGASGPLQPATPNVPSVRQPQKKKSFLSLLCCGTPDHANFLDAPVPANKVSRFNFSRPTTAKQPESSKMGQQASAPAVPQIEKEPTQQPQQVPQVEVGEAKHDVTTEETTKATASSSDANGEPDHTAGSSHDQPLPDLPTVVEAEPAKPEVPNPTVSVDPQTQTEAVAVDAVSPSTDLGQQDGEDEKRASVDPGTTAIEEAPIPLLKDEPVTTGQQTLPPPPPVPQSPASEETVSIDSMEQKQQWLLPPIAPRFKGKKCLVLDLDETLVHSSFKVGPQPFQY